MALPLALVGIGTSPGDGTGDNGQVPFTKVNAGLTLVNNTLGQTPMELAASVTPVNYNYLPGDPRRYGAKMDGATDDTTAVTNWAKVGGALSFPALTSIVSSAIPVPSGTTITATRGGILKTNTPGISVLSLTSVTDVTIRGMHIQQTAGNNTGNIGLINFNGANDCLVENCKLDGANWAGICLQNGSLRNTIRANLFTGATTGTVPQDQNDLAVLNSSNYNIVDGNCFFGGGQHAVLCQDQYNSPAQTCYKNTFVNNRIGTHSSYGIAIYQPGLCVNGAISLTNPGTIAGGTLYTNGNYFNVPLTGGAGTGATANISIIGGAVVEVVIVNAGTNYVSGNTLSASAANLGGTGSGFTLTINLSGGVALVGLTPTTGGTLYTNGQYNSISLTGGSGSGATANITVSGGAVTGIVVVNTGSGYHVGDSLSATAASIGGTGSGFTLVLGTLVNPIVSPENSWNQVSNNHIEDITGASSFNTSSGMGIYVVGAACGGTQVLNNTVKNCCINTATGRTLPPGGITISGFYSGVAPAIVSNNTVSNMPQYEGINCSNILSGAAIIGNTVNIPPSNTTGVGIRIENSNGVALTANIVNQQGTAQGILCYANTSYCNNVVVNGNTVVTSNGAPFTATFNNAGLTLTGMNVADNTFTTTATPNGMLIANVVNGQFANNYVSTGNQTCLAHTNSTRCRYVNNTFLSTSGSTIVQFNGTNTNGSFDKSNTGEGAGIGVANTGTGMLVETYGAAIPTQGTWGLGDRIINTMASTTAETQWVCSVAGAPGTWLGVSTQQAAAMVTSPTTLTNNGAATSPTLGAGGPAGATTPTKWIPINDNGTTRNIPAW